MKQKHIPVVMNQLHSTIDYKALVEMQSTEIVSQVPQQKISKQKVLTAPKRHRRNR